MPPLFINLLDLLAVEVLHVNTSPRIEIVLFYSSIILLHFIIIFYGKWDTIYTITKSSLPVTISLYSGTFESTHGKLYSSLRDIPRIYYYIGQSIEDICFIIFSLTGYLIGKRSNQTNKYI